MAKSLTPADLSAMIEKDEYIVHEGTTLTICVLTLKNGHMLLGHSRPIDEANFDVDKGRKAAFDRAFAQLWDLGGFWARQQAADEANT